MPTALAMRMATAGHGFGLGRGPGHGHHSDGFGLARPISYKIIHIGKRSLIYVGYLILKVVGMLETNQCT